MYWPRIIIIIKTSVLLSSQPTNTHRLSGSCLFLSQACHDSATLPSDCVRSWHTEQSKQGSTVYFHSSLVQVPAVCCLRVIFPPCARVFMQWRNLGRTVILLSHRNKRERQRKSFVGSIKGSRWLYRQKLQHHFYVFIFPPSVRADMPLFLP